MISQDYWKKFYSKKHKFKPSSFAKFCLPYIKKNGYLTELGCGNGRDVDFFLKKGIDAQELMPCMKTIISSR
jgi:hypothetical protein